MLHKQLITVLLVSSSGKGQRLNAMGVGLRKCLLEKKKKRETFQKTEEMELTENVDGGKAAFTFWS